jgi:hypothetical protein
MSRGNYWILHGHTPVATDDVHEWGDFFQDTNNRRVGATDIGDVTVSTVFLGIDHNFGGGPPLLFETMIFGGPHDQYTDRYETWEQAEAGHARAVRIAEGLEEPK